MDNPVISSDIRIDDVRSIYGHASTGLRNSQEPVPASLDSFYVYCFVRKHVGGQFSRQDVVAQDGRELIIVFGLK